MDWISWIFLVMLGLGGWGVCLIAIEGARHRRKFANEGKPTGSLWHHMNVYLEEERATSKPDKASHPATKPKPKPKRTTASEKTVVFMYEDAEGNLSTREVRPIIDDGVYLKGFCYAAGEQRTFRRDRILTVISGEHLLRSATPMNPQPRRQAPKAIEILFTGFSEDDRQDLELDAELNDMRVRKSVTRNLTFVCAGPNAGPRKLAEARAQGCQILSEDEFHHLLETGEVPA